MKAVAYIRVSSTDQVDGHSLDAQERLFHELCTARGWEPVGVYREEGRSAKYEAISKRPVFQQLLLDAQGNRFDAVVVHTLDCWSRNLKVTLETVSLLAKNNVGLVSITENIDWSSPQGRLVGQMLGGFAEYFSGALSTHVKKGVSERARMGFHLGGIPFGYQTCKPGSGEDRNPCDPEHPGGVHLVEAEAEVVREMFRQYDAGATSLSQLARWVNNKGFRTRNMHRLFDGGGGSASGPRMFTTASIKGILHNPFYSGRVRHRDQLLPGLHEPLVSEGLFQSVQDTLRRNSGRSRTLAPHPEREYLLKGLIRCAYCRMPMWAQTYVGGNRYYREHRGSRGEGACVNHSGSIACHIPDEQIGSIIQAIVLPDAWMDRVLAQVQAADEVERVRTRRLQVTERLRRLGKAYVDQLVTDEGYSRQKRALQLELQSLVVPEVDAAKAAGELLEHLPALWEKADQAERRKLLLTMLEAVYVDAREERRVVAIKPRPAFRPVFQVATTREGSGIVLINEEPGDHDEGCCPATNGKPPGSGSEGFRPPCLWWRRGRVELPVQRAPTGTYSRRIRRFGLARASPAGGVRPGQPI